MNKLKITQYSILIFLIISFSCSNKVKYKDAIIENYVDGDSISYAKGFLINRSIDYDIVTIKNPWQGAQNVEYKYALVKDTIINPKIDGNYNIIKTPVKKVVCLSTTHIAFIDVLNETETVVGISGTNYVNNSKIREKINKQKVVDVGYDNSLNFELIALLNPDLVITYGVGGQVASYNQKLNELGIQTIIIAEYLENDPLGKLEWIKLFGALYDKEDLAKNYFNKIKNEYQNLLALTEKKSNKPKVLFGLPYKDTWYVPGGNSFLAKMTADAGGDYIWKSNESRESLPFDLESVFINASDAEIWLNNGTVLSKNDILKVDERFEDFNPFISGKIFNNNLMVNEFGGNDYWEKGLIEPHIVLKDMIKIFHPELLPSHDLVYYKIIK
ncbi:ABC transporter substrate-binding protein [Bacteroidota bacterium]